MRRINYFAAVLVILNPANYFGEVAAVRAKLTGEFIQ